MTWCLASGTSITGARGPIRDDIYGAVFTRDERALFTKDERGATAHRLQILADGLAETTRAHGLAVELPDPAVLSAPQ